MFLWFSGPEQEMELVLHQPIAMTTVAQFQEIVQLGTQMLVTLDIYIYT